jgi:hypothetical protein
VHKNSPEVSDRCLKSIDLIALFNLDFFVSFTVDVREGFALGTSDCRHAIGVLDFHCTRHGCSLIGLPTARHFVSDYRFDSSFWMASCCFESLI